MSVTCCRVRSEYIAQELKKRGNTGNGLLPLALLARHGTTPTGVCLCLGGGDQHTYPPEGAGGGWGLEKQEGTGRLGWEVGCAPAPPSQRGRTSRGMPQLLAQEQEWRQSSTLAVGDAGRYAACLGVLGSHTR